MNSGFLHQLGLIVIGATLCAVVTRKLKLPSIVAYLLAGLVLGPWSGWVETTESVNMISQVGIVLLLFLVGLELSLEKIKGMGKAVLVAGLVQVILTSAGGFGLARLLGFSAAESTFWAIALTFSSTVIAVKLLEEKHQFDSLHGRLAVGILLLQDLVALVVLTLMAGFKPDAQLEAQALAGSVIVALIKMAGLVAVVLLAARYILPRPFAWAARSPATLMIWSLCWCFFIVWAAHGLKLSEETGAFLAGLSLAQLPYNHDLRRRIHPLTNFFIAVFFVSLGVKMDLSAATANWPIVLSFVLFALIGKFAIVMFTLARLKFSERTAHSAALTLSQVSEFSFIVAAAAVGAGWINDRIFSILALVGLATFGISSCLIVYNVAACFWLKQIGVLQLFRARRHDVNVPRPRPRLKHVIIVGMNTLGRMIATRLHERGETVIAIDTDPHKLRGLPCETLLGNVEYASVLDEVNLKEAKLLVSALRIEPTNDLLAYRAKQAGVPSSIQAVDLENTDNLLEMDVKFLMIPKVDGIKLQTHELQQRGLIQA